MNEVGAHLKERLIEETRDFPLIVGQVRGMGFSLGLDIVHNGIHTEPNPTLCHLIRNKMIKRQVLSTAVLCILQRVAERLEVEKILKDFGGGHQNRLIESLRMSPHVICLS